MDIEFKRYGTPVVREQLTSKSGQFLEPEHFSPVRDISNEQWRTSRPGLAYCASIQQLVPCESRLEMFAVLMLDFEGEVESLTAQPFTLHFRPNRQPAAHTPDFFYRNHRGEGVVVDVKPSEFLLKSNVQTQFRASREACEQTGWTHRIISTPTRAFSTNLNLLSGYRKAPPAYSEYLNAIYDTLRDGPLPWAELGARVEDVTGAHSAFIPPLVLHALWAHHLTADLSRLLTRKSFIGMTPNQLSITTSHAMGAAGRTQQ